MTKNEAIEFVIFLCGQYGWKYYNEQIESSAKGKFYFNNMQDYFDAIKEAFIILEGLKNDPRP